jgi:choline kinase
VTGVILAAGIASRLRPLTEHTPKCLLSVGGKPLLQRNLEALHHNGIRQCLIVTGYLAEQIESFVRGLGLPMEIEFIRNPVFDQTNNNYSLWLTRDAVRGDDIVLLDGDILFDRRILTRLLASPHADALILRECDHLGAEEIKCTLDAQGAVIQIGKQLDPKASAGESLGIEKFSAATTSKLFEVLAHRHVHNEFYEASFQEMIDNGARVFTVSTDGLACTEIDTPSDLTAAEAIAARLE